MKMRNSSKTAFIFLKKRLIVSLGSWQWLRRWKIQNLSAKAQKTVTQAKMLKFLKEEYGTGGSAPAVGLIDINHDSRGITLF